MDNQAQRELAQEISDIIEGQRVEIAAGVSVAISDHISKKSPSECLELVLRDDVGTVTKALPMAADIDYGKALIAFVRGKDFNGQKIDSALTDSTSEVVADVFSKKIGEKADAISDKIMPLLISDKRFIVGLSEAVVESYSGTIPKHLQRKVINAFSGKLAAALAQSIDTTTTATIKASVVKVTAASISSPISLKVTAALVKAMSVALKPIILKLLASSAFKAAIMAKLKAVVVGAMLGAFFKIIGVKLGLSAGAVFMWVVIPLVIAWILYEISNFPNKLAQKVTEGVVSDLETNFSETSFTMAETLVEKIIVEGAGMLAIHLLNDDILLSVLTESINDEQ